MNQTAKPDRAEQIRRSMAYIRRELAAALRNLASAARDAGESRQSVAQARESLTLCSELGDIGGILAGLAILVEALAEETNDEIAVRLLGAIDALRRQTDTSAELIGGRDQTLLIAALRERLGSDAFIAAWESGRSLLAADAVQLALAPHGNAPQIPPVVSQADELSPRQREVVRLITEGLSNKKIAEALFISERTADTHVEHILRKLDMHSRAQVAAWEMERRAKATLPGRST